MAIHSILPATLTEAAETVLREAGLTHVAHGDRDPVAAAEAVVSDPAARAVIGPLRSRAVAEVVEVTAPAGLPLLAPVATWAGVTRSDEPGCEDDPARHLGTVIRLVARDTVVAHRIAERVRGNGSRALVVAGEHEYGAQLDAQLELAGLPRAVSAAEADLVVLAGLPGEPELDEARALAPLPIVAFDLASAAQTGGYFAARTPALRARALAAGVLLRPLGGVIYAMPPTSTSEEQCGRIAAAMAEVARHPG